jgi:hypothetical protein
MEVRFKDGLTLWFRDNSQAFDRMLAEAIQRRRRELANALPPPAIPEADVDFSDGWGFGLREEDEEFSDGGFVRRGRAGRGRDWPCLVHLVADFLGLLHLVTGLVAVQACSRHVATSRRTRAKPPDAAPRGGTGDGTGLPRCRQER